MERDLARRHAHRADVFTAKPETLKQIDQVHLITLHGIHTVIGPFEDSC